MLTVDGGVICSKNLPKPPHSLTACLFSFHRGSLLSDIDYYNMVMCLFSFLPSNNFCMDCSEAVINKPISLKLQTYEFTPASTVYLGPLWTLNAQLSDIFETAVLFSPNICMNIVWCIITKVNLYSLCCFSCSILCIFVSCLYKDAYCI